MTVKVTKTYFSGVSRVHDASEGGLADVVRKVMQDNARNRLQAAIADVTDNSGGTPNYSSSVATLQAQNYSSTLVPDYETAGTDMSPKAGFDTAIGKIANAQAVIAEHLNQLAAPLGLPLITNSTGGTVAALRTVPALDLTLTAVSANGVNPDDARARLQTIAANTSKLAGMVNRIAVAVGETKVNLDSLGYTFPGTLTLDAITSTGAAVAGSTAAPSLADSVVDAELGKIADNIATLVEYLNAMAGAAPSDLTDNSGGTASVTSTLVANAAPDAADGAATTSSPKAGFDAELAKIENNLSDLTLRTNLLLERNNLASSKLTDNTGVTPNTTIEALSVDLTAVDGSSGTAAVDVTTATARMGTINNALASIAAKVNVLAPTYGVKAITDSTGGTASSTIADVAATATGVSGAGATMLDTDVDTWLSNNRNNIATLAAKLNEMTGTEASYIPLQAIAWDE